MKKLTSLLITTLAGAARARRRGLQQRRQQQDGHRGLAPAPAAQATAIHRYPADLQLDRASCRTPSSGVVGAWYAYGDGVGSNASVGDAGVDNSDSDCVKKGGFPQSACTQITIPTPGHAVPADRPRRRSQMCTTGIAALVMNKGGAPDYTDLWGGGIGLDFNNPGGDAGVAGYSDLSAYTASPFDFSGDVVPSKCDAGQLPVHGRARHRLALLDGARTNGVLAAHRNDRGAPARRDPLGRRRRPVLPDRADARRSTPRCTRSTRRPSRRSSSRCSPTPRRRRPTASASPTSRCIQELAIDRRARQRAARRKATCGSTAGGFFVVRGHGAAVSARDRAAGRATVRPRSRR